MSDVVEGSTLSVTSLSTTQPEAPCTLAPKAFWRPSACTWSLFALRSVPTVKFYLVGKKTQTIKNQHQTQNATCPLTVGKRSKTMNPYSEKPPKPTENKSWKWSKPQNLLKKTWTVRRHSDCINTKQQEHKWTLWEKKLLTFLLQEGQTTKNSLTQTLSVGSHTRAVCVGSSTQFQAEQ